MIILFWGLCTEETERVPPSLRSSQPVNTPWSVDGIELVAPSPSLAPSLALFLPRPPSLAHQRRSTLRPAFCLRAAAMETGVVVDDRERPVCRDRERGRAREREIEGCTEREYI